MCRQVARLFLKVANQNHFHGKGSHNCQLTSLADNSSNGLVADALQLTGKKIALKRPDFSTPWPYLGIYTSILFFQDKTRKKCFQLNSSVTVKKRERKLENLTALFYYAYFKDYKAFLILARKLIRFDPFKY